MQTGFTMLVSLSPPYPSEYSPGESLMWVHNHFVVGCKSERGVKRHKPVVSHVSLSTTLPPQGKLPKRGGQFFRRNWVCHDSVLFQLCSSMMNSPVCQSRRRVMQQQHGLERGGEKEVWVHALDKYMPHSSSPSNGIRGRRYSYIAIAAVTFNIETIGEYGVLIWAFGPWRPQSSRMVGLFSAICWFWGQNQ